MKIDVIEKIGLIKNIEFPNKALTYFSVDIYNSEGTITDCRNFMKYEDALEYYKSISTIVPSTLKLYLETFFGEDESDLDFIDISCNFEVVSTKEVEL